MASVALLDANVLWSAALRDTLLLAAEAGLFRAVWTRRILGEMSHSLKAKRPDLDPARIDRTVDQILSHFPEALVEGYEDLIVVMQNDPGDRHVLAAAVRSGTDIIVTWNRAHFPAAACAPYEIDVQDPDEFLCTLLSSYPEEIAAVLIQQAAHLISPPQTVHQVIETLEKSVPRFAREVRSSGLLDSG